MTPEQFSEICKQYDEAPEEFGWDQEHPIFCLAQENDSLQQRVRSMQAKIDSLMLEYCPDEMTPEQIKNWERSQSLADICALCYHHKSEAKSCYRVDCITDKLQPIDLINVLGSSSGWG